MDLFAYSWYYTGYAICGHCLDDGGRYRLLRVRDYRPSCYVEGERLPSCSVVPLKAEYKLMVTSRDISTKKPFHRVFFKNIKHMNDFASEVKYGVYMADIPQVNVFLSQNDVDHVGWVRVENTTVTNSDNVVYDVESASIRAMKDKDPLSSPKVMVFDIEVRSADMGMPRPYMLSDTVEMISVVFFDVGKPELTKKYLLHVYPKLQIDEEQLIYEDEVGLIRGFFELMNKEDPTVITGFNIFNFDIKYLVSRLQLRLLEIPDVSKGIKNTVDIIKVDWASDAYGHNKYDRLVIGGRIILDMFLYFKRMKLDKYSLDFVSNKFLGEGKNDMHFKDMMEAFRTEDIGSLSTVAKYCVQDSVLVMRLFEKVQMWIDACEISKITRCSIEDIYTRGEQMKMISQCVKECALRGIVLQPLPRDGSKWPDYEGAYVLEPVKGVYDNCCLMDFQSLYPSIIIAHNICPSTYVSSYHGSHKFLKEPIGMLPGMIKRILDERKAVKSAMKELDRSSISYVVLDRRQNALKICANSVYGMMGFKNSRYFGHIACAESVTSIGRECLANVVKTIEKDYPVKVVYGDSVTGYTPTIVRFAGRLVLLETIENLATLWGNDRWIRSNDGKESCELYGLEAWTDDGWTRLHRVIRHVLAPHKRILRIITHTGLVDVTDEHSLLNTDGEPVNAKYAKVGDKLLHHPYPVLSETMNEKSVPFRASGQRLQAFLDVDQITVASFAMLASSLGYSISFNTKLDVLRLNVAMAKQEIYPETIKKIHEIEYTGYVYDLTTDNHRFQAGPGMMIVHNTDSCLITPSCLGSCLEAPFHTSGQEQTGAKAPSYRNEIIELSKKICVDITAQLPVPMVLMFESYCRKAILLTKKRYVLVGDDAVTYKGVMTARRDYCKYAKDLYRDVIDMITAGENADTIASRIDLRILKLALGRCDVFDLVITKSISKDLKSYVVNQPQVVLARRLQKETGIDVSAGTRLEYVFVKEGVTQAEKMRTLEELASSPYTIDGRYYIEKQLVNQIDDILSLIGLDRYIKKNWL